MENENKKNFFTIAAFILIAIAFIVGIVAYFILDEPVRDTGVNLWGGTSSAVSYAALFAALAAFAAAIIGIVVKRGSKGARIAALIISIVIFLGSSISAFAVSILVNITKRANGDKEVLSYVDDETLKKLDDMIEDIVTTDRKSVV